MGDLKREALRCRVVLTVSSELDEVLGRIAVAYSKPKATVITDILNDAIPSLKKIATVAERLKVVQQGVANLWRRAPHGS